MELAGGERAVISLDVGGQWSDESAGSDPAYDSVPAWIAAGVGLVGIGMFVGFGVSAESIYDELVEDCPAEGCSTRAHRERADRGKTHQIVANVSLVAGLVCLATAGVFFTLDAVDADGSGGEPAAAALRLGPANAELLVRF